MAMKTTSHSFKQLVELFRLLDCPPLIEDKFTATVNSSSAVNEVLGSLWSSKGCDIDLNIDGDSFETGSDDTFPELQENKALSITVKVYPTEKGFFYQNVTAWIDGTSTLKKGEFAPNTYLIEEDSIITEAHNNQAINKVLTVCQLIEKLSQLAHFHDEKKGANNAYRLVFVMPDKGDKVYHPVILQTQLSNAILQLEKPDLSILCHILEQQKEGSNNIHASEKLSVFRIAVAEIIEAIPSDEEPITHLVKNWENVIDTFNKSWESYLSGFSFSKLKTEIAEQQALFSQKLTDTVASLSGRLFSLPLSIAAIALLEKTHSPIANGFYLLSSLLLSFMVADAVKMQSKNLSNVKASYKMAFSAFEKQNKQQINSINTELKKVRKELNETIKKLENSLFMYRLLAWTPLLAALAYVTYTFNNEVGLTVYLQCMIQQFI